jgi:hypothetical protein
MLGVTGLFDPLGLYQKDTAPRRVKTRGPMIVANGVSPIAEFGLNVRKASSTKNRRTLSSSPVEKNGLFLLSSRGSVDRLQR